MEIYHQHKNTKTAVVRKKTETIRRKLYRCYVFFRIDPTKNVALCDYVTSEEADFMSDLGSSREPKLEK